VHLIMGSGRERVNKHWQGLCTNIYIDMRGRVWWHYRRYHGAWSGDMLDSYGRKLALPFYL
jgi:hypothetical protein